jgi:hypothetical protein
MLMIRHEDGTTRGIASGSETAMICIRLELVNQADVDALDKIVWVNIADIIGMPVKFKLDKSGNPDMATIQPRNR